MKVLMGAFLVTMDIIGPIMALKMTAFCNMSKDKGRPVLLFSQALVIKKSI